MCLSSGIAILTIHNKSILCYLNYLLYIIYDIEFHSHTFSLNIKLEFMEVEPRGNILQLYEIIRQSKIRTSMNRFVMSCFSSMKFA